MSEIIYDIAAEQEHIRGLVAHLQGDELVKRLARNSRSEYSRGFFAGHKAGYSEGRAATEADTTKGVVEAGSVNIGL